jgi:hypothetical protein
MSHQDDIELRLARWLEEGPQGAPTQPIAAVLEHARAHPRPRWAIVGHWRTLMSGTNLTHIGPRTSQAGWLLAAAAVVIVVVGVAAGYGLLQSSNPGTGVGGPGNATASPAASPTAAVITGSESCSTTTSGAVTTLDGVEQSRGERVLCATTMSDPRLTGEGSAILNANTMPDGSWSAWGTRVITNAGGTWQGPFFMEGTGAARSMTFDVVLMGEDGYAGLTFRAEVVTSPSATTFTGAIEPTGPAITGHSDCVARSGGTDTPIGDLTATRGAVLVCGDEADDPRVSGTSNLGIDMDIGPDGSGVMWGTQLLTNANGKWVGRWFGTVDPGFTTHHVEALLRGTGAYDGLLMRQTVTGDDTIGYDAVTRIIPAQ